MRTRSRENDVSRFRARAAHAGAEAARAYREGSRDGDGLDGRRLVCREANVASRARLDGNGVFDLCFDRIVDHILRQRHANRDGAAE